jgi:hypothetical protein
MLSLLSGVILRDIQYAIIVSNVKVKLNTYTFIRLGKLHTRYYTYVWCKMRTTYTLHFFVSMFKEILRKYLKLLCNFSF